MRNLELWHVFVDNGTGRRSCQYGYRDALTFNPNGDFMRICDGKTEIQPEEWTDEEIAWAISGILKTEKRNRLAAMPGLFLLAMKECSVPDGERSAVMGKILHKMQKPV